MNGTTRPFRTAAARTMLVAGVAAMVAYLVARFALEATAPGHPWGILLALAPLPFLALFIHAAYLALRQADELVRRMHLEAMAFAFLATIALLMVLGLLEGRPEGGSVELRNVWAFLPPLYGVGLGLATERYR